jgi:hypothetical protein
MVAGKQSISQISFRRFDPCVLLICIISIEITVLPRDVRPDILGCPPSGLRLPSKKRGRPAAGLPKLAAIT